MLHKLKVGFQIARDFGWRWTYRRLLYEARLRLGHHKRTLPMRSWRPDEHREWVSADIDTADLLSLWKSDGGQFLFDEGQLDRISNHLLELYGNQASTIVGKLSDTRIDNVLYFCHERYAVDTDEIWFQNPRNNTECSPDKHWSEYPMYTPEYEDLKYIWEYGRFTVVYDLVRAYAFDRKEIYAEQFWQLVDKFYEHNPPNTGPQWKCGQETSLRLMAIYFGLYAFKNARATTVERFNRLVGAVAAQAYRVSKDLEYSYLQHSNHAVSEGLGLYVTAQVFPFLKDADAWRKRGKEILTERLQFLVRPDGTYVQKSQNYMRFIMQAYTYVMAVADANDDPFPEVFHDRMKQATFYLSQTIDLHSGLAPNYGSNDGALIFPVSATKFPDFRPTVESLQIYYYGERLFDRGIWLEDSVWLWGTERVSRSQPCSRTIPEQGIFEFEDGGIFTLRAAPSWMFTHAEAFTDRPGHADALHFDLWWKGHNICIDTGTYMYYGHAPWKDAFKHTHHHNTVVIDGLDQMERGYRFTWGYWHDTRILDRYQNDTLSILTAAHHGYHRLADRVTHRRTFVQWRAEYWLVIDDILTTGTHQWEQHWIIGDFEMTMPDARHVIVHTDDGKYAIRQLSDDLTSTEAHAATYYGKMNAATRLTASGTTDGHYRTIVAFGPEGFAAEHIDKHTIRLSTADQNHTDDIRLQPLAADLTIQHA